MKKFLVLYMAPTAVLDEIMKNSAPERMKENMDEWRQWVGRKGNTLIDMGSPAGKNLRVAKGGTSMVRNEVCGYSLAQGASQEEVAKAFEVCPHLELEGAYIEVVAMLEMPGM